MLCEELFRESRESRERTRRCNRGLNPQNTTVQCLEWEGAEDRMIREPEDLFCRK